MFARNAIPAGRYPTGTALAERICSAEALRSPTVTAAQKAAARKQMYALLGAAAVVLIVAGVLIWRTVSGRSESVPALSEATVVLLESYGITEEDLANIRDVVIVGDHFAYYTEETRPDPYSEAWPGLYDVASEVSINEAEGYWGNFTWYWNEDGGEALLTAYDFGFLLLMPNLQELHMALVDAREMPDLSSLTALNEVWMLDCALDDLAWLSETNVARVHVRADVDYAPLAACEQLNHVVFDLFSNEQADLSQFSPAALEEVEFAVTAAVTAVDFSGLAACENLRQVHINNAPIRDLSFLVGLPSVKEVRLQAMPQLRDVSALGSLENLQELEIFDCQNVTDLSAVRNCAELSDIELNGLRQLMDASFLAGHRRINGISLYDSPLRNLDFLRDIEVLDPEEGLDLAISGEIQDYSGLAAISHYKRLHVNPNNRNFAAVLPYLQGITIDDFQIWDSSDVDLSALPEVTRELTLSMCDLTDLTGLPAWDITTLRLQDMQYLTSLDGVENLNYFGGVWMGELCLDNCPRLTDYSALSGMTLAHLEVHNQYTLPSFENFGAQFINLNNIIGMTDLHCFDALDAGYLYNISLSNMEDIVDLSPLTRLTGYGIGVPPQLAEQAAELVETGKSFENYYVNYPEGGWELDNSPITLLSLDELDTLPDALLRRVDRLWLAGDQIVDPDRYDIWERWEDGAEQSAVVLHDRETDEEIPVEQGELADLSRLAKLENLHELALAYQPLTDLSGIQELSSLDWLHVIDCFDLTDASAAFALDGLEGIELRNSPVTSIQGVQNLTELRDLNLCSTRVSDLSPLSEHPSVEELRISWNEQLADLTPLLAMPNLRYVSVSNNMEQALASLEGAHYSFALEIEE